MLYLVSFIVYMFCSFIQVFLSLLSFLISIIFHLSLIFLMSLSHLMTITRNKQKIIKNYNTITHNKNNNEYSLYAWQIFNVCIYFGIMGEYTYNDFGWLDGRCCVGVADSFLLFTWMKYPQMIAVVNDVEYSLTVQPSPCLQNICTNNLSTCMVW